jgi:hypothetical protein
MEPAKIAGNETPKLAARIPVCQLAHELVCSPRPTNISAILLNEIGEVITMNTKSSLRELMPRKRISFC